MTFSSSTANSDQRRSPAEEASAIEGVAWGMDKLLLGLYPLLVRDHDSEFQTLPGEGEVGMEDPDQRLVQGYRVGEVATVSLLANRSERAGERLSGVVAGAEVCAVGRRDSPRYLVCVTCRVDVRGFPHVGLGRHPFQRRRP